MQGSGCRVWGSGLGHVGVACPDAPHPHPPMLLQHLNTRFVRVGVMGSFRVSSKPEFTIANTSTLRLSSKCRVSCLGLRVNDVGLAEWGLGVDVWVLGLQG